MKLEFGDAVSQGIISKLQFDNLIEAYNFDKNYQKVKDMYMVMYNNWQKREKERIEKENQEKAEKEKAELEAQLKANITTET